MPVEAHGVTHAMGKYFEPRAVELQAGNRGIPFVSPLADITRRTHRYVEPAIPPHTDKLPAMMRVAGIAVVDHNGRWRPGQTRLNVVIAQNAVDLSHIQGPVMEGDAVRRV